MEEEILLHFYGNNFKYFILLSLIIILSLNKTSQNYDLFFILTRNYRALFVRRKDYLKYTNNPSFSENNLTGFI